MNNSLGKFVPLGAVLGITMGESMPVLESLLGEGALWICGFRIIFHKCGVSGVSKMR